VPRARESPPGHTRPYCGRWCATHPPLDDTQSVINTPPRVWSRREKKRSTPTLRMEMKRKNLPEKKLASAIPVEGLQDFSKDIRLACGLKDARVKFACLRKGVERHGPSGPPVKVQPLALTLLVGPDPLLSPCLDLMHGQ